MIKPPSSSARTAITFPQHLIAMPGPMAGAFTLWNDYAAEVTA